MKLSEVIEPEEPTLDERKQRARRMMLELQQKIEPLFPEFDMTESSFEGGSQDADEHFYYAEYALVENAHGEAEYKIKAYLDGWILIYMLDELRHRESDKNYPQLVARAGGRGAKAWDVDAVVAAVKVKLDEHPVQPRYVPLEEQ